MNKLISFISAALLISSVVIGSSTIATATPKAEEKVTICHATNAVKNPYVKITVDKSAVDGASVEKNTTHGDHFSEHTGPVATSEKVAQDLKDDKKSWGDIIPPVGKHSGLNWTAEGKAMYNKDCKFATPGEVLSDTTTTPTPGTGLSTPAELPETGFAFNAAIALIAGIVTYVAFSTSVVRKALSRLV